MKSNSRMAPGTIRKRRSSLSAARLRLDDYSSQDRWNQAMFFWVGLFGIVATGAMIGMGGDNYWAIARPFDVPWNHRSAALLGVFIFLVGLCDLIGLAVIFAGAVIVIQRLRGVSSN